MTRDLWTFLLGKLIQNIQHYKVYRIKVMATAHDNSAVFCGDNEYIDDAPSGILAQSMKCNCFYIICIK